MVPAAATSAVFMPSDRLVASIISAAPAADDARIITTKGIPPTTNGFFVFAIGGSPSFESSANARGVARSAASVPSRSQIRSMKQHFDGYVTLQLEIPRR